MSKLLEFFTGALVPTERTLAPAAPMSPAEWRGRFRQALADEKAACLHWEQAARRVAELRTLAHDRSDLQRVAREEEALANPPAMPQRQAEPTVRVRVREGFSTEWRGIPYDAPTGSVVDLPKSFVRAAGHLFDVLDDQSTPLHRVQPAVEYPR